MLPSEMNCGLIANRRHVVQCVINLLTESIICMLPSKMKCGLIANKKRYSTMCHKLTYEEEEHSQLSLRLLWMKRH